MAFRKRKKPMPISRTEPLRSGASGGHCCKLHIHVSNCNHTVRT